MAKRYFGYADVDNVRGSFVTSAGVGEFDPEEIRDKDKSIYQEFMKGNKRLARNLVELYPTKVYFSIDNLDLDQKKFATTEAAGLGWSVALEDIRDNLQDAWKQIYKHKSAIFREIFERPVH